MKTLAICTTKNKIGRHDGDEFKRECDRFCKIHNGQALYYRREFPGRRRQLCETFLRSAGKLGGPVDAVAFFGHGGASQLYCTGHARRHIPQLAEALRSCLRLDRQVYVLLYACLTGKGFGFADSLDVALEGRGINVRTIAHTTAGHTTWNPSTEDSGEGPKSKGIDLIPRDSHLYQRWRQRLHDDQDFRLSFWAMTHGQLLAELGDAPAPKMPPLPEKVKNQV